MSLKFLFGLCAAGSARALSLSASQCSVLQEKEGSVQRHTAQQTQLGQDKTAAVVQKVLKLVSFSNHPTCVSQKCKCSTYLAAKSDGRRLSMFLICVFVFTFFQM